MQPSVKSHIAEDSRKEFTQPFDFLQIVFLPYITNNIGIPSLYLYVVDFCINDACPMELLGRRVHIHFLEQAHWLGYFPEGPSWHCMAAHFPPSPAQQAVSCPDVGWSEGQKLKPHHWMSVHLTGSWAPFRSVFITYVSWLASQWGKKGQHICYTHLGHTTMRPIIVYK